MEPSLPASTPLPARNPSDHRLIPALLRGDSNVLAPLILNPGAAFWITLLGMVVLGAGAYGVAVGSWRGGWQPLFTGLKLPGILLLSFAPVAWVFSESSSSVGFVGFLHWLLWLISVSFGLRLGRTCLHALGAAAPGTFIVWSGIFILVTLQMATALRPWLGKSDAVFAKEKISFLGHWGDSLSEKPPSRATPTMP